MGRFGIGQSVRRTEDVRFITGHGRYTDDIDLPGQAHGVVLRSPHAHAVIRSIDLAAARGSRGVVAVFVGADLEADGIGHIPIAVELETRVGRQIIPPRPALSGDRVRYVGDGVAFIVAETAVQAKDAAELIDIDYDPLDAAATLARASASGAPVLWEDAPGNVCFDWEMGDAEAVATALDGADRVVRLDILHNRLVANPVETRAAIGAYDDGAGRYTLHTSSQGAHGLRRALADAVFKIDHERIRVITPDVGGGFGMKGFLYPEQILVLWAARKLGRPVKWTGERYEAFQSDNHGRDLLTTAELGIDGDGRILGLRVDGKANLGAYLSPFGAFIPTVALARVLGGVYRVPAIHIAMKGYFSNSVPVDAYRGAGRPEAAYITESLVARAARESGLGQDEFRRRNLLRPDELPYSHPLGFVFDSGDFAANMEDAMSHAGWNDFAERRAAARARGRLRGIGMSYYVESTLGNPIETASIRFGDDGKVALGVGTQSNGQGHETTFAQILHQRLGVPFEAIELVQGDTDIIATGGGTGGSRSLHLQGHAILNSADAVIEKGRRLAARLLEAAEVDIEFADGVFTIAGTDRTLDIMTLAREAREQPHPLDDESDGFEDGLDTVAGYELDAPTFPNGCHICEVEIDPETGVLTVERYTVVDDFGVVINPAVVEGQVQGGAVQGISQAILENCIYDDESGQLLTGSFMDYAMPRADDLPDIDFHTNEIPCATNPLGIKGCGEAGTVGAMPAVVNAALDALAERGITDIDAPLTPLRIWEALEKAGKA